MTEIQLMAVTDHKSTTALKKYAANSTVQKRNAANAFSISGPPSQLYGKENVIQNHPREITVKRGRGNFEIILNNSTVSTLKVIQGNQGDEKDGLTQDTI